MAFSRGPRIVTDGLVLALDAGNVKSYPGTNSVCYDRSGYGNNGTLINGASFTDDGGISRFQLDGVNDRIDIPKDLNGFEHNIQYDIDWTIECWMNTHQPDTTPQRYKMIYGNYNGCNYSALPGNAGGILIFNADNPSQCFTNLTFGAKSPTGCPDSISWNNSETSWFYSFAVDKWCHFVMTSDDGTYYKIYVNGQQRGSTKTFDFKNSSGRTANNLESSRNYSWGGEFIGNSSNEVDFSIMRIYNRPLLSGEILQNYNAQKIKFGL